MRSAILCLVFVPQLYACSCVMLMSKCDRAWNPGETIFLGKVTTIEKTPNIFTGPVHLTVDESFRGAAAAGTEIVIHSDGSNCNYPFVEGASYVVYATTDPRDGFLYTSRCSETRPAVMMEGAMRELRAVRDGTRQDKVFGTIGISAGGGNLEAWIGARPLPAVPVRAIDSKGKSFKSQTDDRGVYVFSSLPSGIYKIEPDLPKGFATSPLLTAEVTRGLACRIDHFAAAP
jgi:hypothetical protein